MFSFFTVLTFLDNPVIWDYKQSIFFAELNFSNLIIKQKTDWFYFS